MSTNYNQNIKQTNELSYSINYKNSKKNAEKHQKNNISLKYNNHQLIPPISLMNNNRSPNNIQSIKGKHMTQLSQETHTFTPERPIQRINHPLDAAICSDEIATIQTN